MIKIVLGFYFVAGTKILGRKRQDFMRQDLTQIKNVLLPNYLPCYTIYKELV